MNNEQTEYLKSIVNGRTCKELAEMINKKFNTNYNDKDIYNAKRRNNLKSGVDCTFKKGNPAHNKGKKWNEYMPIESQINSKKTQFKKGNKPHNWLPVGSEWINDKGYTYVKISEPNNWQLKHRYIYEQHHGKIPKGYSIIFLDGNKNNYDLDNLQLVKIREKLIMKNLHFFSTNKELTRTGLITTKLIIKTKEL